MADAGNGFWIPKEFGKKGPWEEDLSRENIGGDEDMLLQMYLLHKLLFKNWLY